jgi:hypothetical protein
MAILLEPGKDKVPTTEKRKITFDFPPELKGLRVVVVDDEPDAVEIITAVLEACRADVRSAFSG